MLDKYSKSCNKIKKTLKLKFHSIPVYEKKKSKNVKKSSSHFANFERVKKKSSHCFSFEQIKILAVILVTLNKLGIKKIS